MLADILSLIARLRALPDVTAHPGNEGPLFPVSMMIRKI